MSSRHPTEENWDRDTCVSFVSDVHKIINLNDKLTLGMFLEWIVMYAFSYHILILAHHFSYPFSLEECTFCLAYPFLLAPLKLSNFRGETPPTAQKLSSQINS